MRILITYSTTEGQTRKVSRFCADQLVSQGHSVELLAASDADDVELALFDAVILAGSVHVGHVQDVLARVAETHAPALNGKPGLFLVVSLAAAGNEPADREDLDRIAREFTRATGWTPGRIEHIAGAFRFSEYDFFRSMAMRWIAWQRGETIDTQTDREYTDWPALAAMIIDWAETNAPLPERAARSVRAAGPV
ncbi:MAG: protoporphyrinogen oxidase [Rhodobacteraceae bacterium]|nr:protoporphyrinogen oxidase [Paracoccaceae bacterium]